MRGRRILRARVDEWPRKRRKGREVVYRLGPGVVAPRRRRGRVWMWVVDARLRVLTAARRLAAACLRGTRRTWIGSSE